MSTPISLIDMLQLKRQYLQCQPSQGKEASDRSACGGLRNGGENDEISASLYLLTTGRKRMNTKETCRLLKTCVVSSEEGLPCKAGPMAHPITLRGVSGARLRARRIIARSQRTVGPVEANSRIQFSLNTRINHKS